jgi:hypothetical protein
LEHTGPRHYLLKSEPHEFSIDDLAAAKDCTEPWDGVRSAQARNILKGMRAGDLCFYYHSNCKQVRRLHPVPWLHRLLHAARKPSSVSMHAAFRELQPALSCCLQAATKHARRRHALLLGSQTPACRPQQHVLQMQQAAGIAWIPAPYESCILLLHARSQASWALRRL